MKTMLLMVVALDMLLGSPAYADEPAVWVSRFTSIAPKIDGVVDDAWAVAQPLKAVVRKAIGGQQSKVVVLRALHTEDTLYVLAQWPDATKSDMRDPFVWNAVNKAYDRPTKPDDQFALEFPLTGDFDVNMLAMGHEYSADVWHWKAGRGNPAGWVDDKRHVISPKPVPEGREYSFGGRGKVYIARLMDTGTPAYREVPLPKTFRGDIVDSYEPCEPSGSLADIRGKGIHDGKTWSLEMCRKFNTGHNDDAVIDPTRDTPCAIAVLDDELFWHHAVSAQLRLRLAEKGK